MGPYGKNVSKCFFSETTWTIETKLPSHLGFPIGIKNSNLVKDIPMIIPLQFGFSQFISFREEDLFSSPGPKVQVNYCHQLASFVCRL
jgi:hypothetical protein